MTTNIFGKKTIIMVYTDTDKYVLQIEKIFQNKYDKIYLYDCKNTIPSFSFIIDMANNIDCPLIVVINDIDVYLSMMDLADWYIIYANLPKKYKKKISISCNLPIKTLKKHIFSNKSEKIICFSRNNDFYDFRHDNVYRILD